MCALILMPFTECQSYIKSAKDTESRAKLKPDCTAEFADVLIAVQSAPYFLNPGLTGMHRRPYHRRPYIICRLSLSEV